MTKRWSSAAVSQECATAMAYLRHADIDAAPSTRRTTTPVQRRRRGRVLDHHGQRPGRAACDRRTTAWSSTTPSRPADVHMRNGPVTGGLPACCPYPCPRPPSADHATCGAPTLYRALSDQERAAPASVAESSNGQAAWSGTRARLTGRRG